MPTLTEILAEVLRQFRVRTPEELARDHPCVIGTESEAPDEIFVPETGRLVVPTTHRRKLRRLSIRMGSWRIDVH